MLIKICSRLRVHTLIFRPAILPCFFYLPPLSANGKFIGKSLKARRGGPGLCLSVGKLLRFDVLQSCLLYKLLTMKRVNCIYHRLIRVVRIQSCSAEAENFTNYVFCHPQFSGVIQSIENRAILTLVCLCQLSK